MNSIIKTFKTLALSSVALLTMSACSDWTETESIKMDYTTLEETNPELYKAYLKSLRDYRTSEHKVVIAKFDNKAEAPVGQAAHIANLPDSVDYVILTNPETINDATLGEMSKIRTDKGTKTLFQVDYKSLETEYKDMVAAEEEKAKNDPTYTAPGDSLERFTAWMDVKVKAYVALISEKNFDGVSIVYNGKSPDSMVDTVKADVKARQESFFKDFMAWADANKSSLLFFEGMPKNLLIDEDVLAKAKYVIISAVSATNNYEFSFNVSSAINSKTPTDKLIIAVTTVSLTDLTNKDGLFAEADDNGNTITAIVGGAYWVNKVSSSYSKAGLSVEASQNDYYDDARIYPNINKAISIMNPSPLN